MNSGEKKHSWVFGEVWCCEWPTPWFGDPKLGVTPLV